MDIANDTYYLLEKNIKKVNNIIENLEQELVNTKFNDFSYQNSLLDKNLDDLVNFESYLNSKFINNPTLWIHFSINFIHYIIFR